LIQKAKLGQDSRGNMTVENKTPEEILDSMKISSRSVLSEASFFPKWKPKVIEKTEQTSKTSEQNRSSPAHKSNLFNMETLNVNGYGQIEGGLKGFWDATSDAMSDFVREENEG